MAMRVIFFASVFFTASACAAAAETPDVPAACRSGENAIQVCSDFLKRKKISFEQRAYALVKRGDAHRARHDTDTAIKDYNKAIKVNLKAGLAFVQRGHVLRHRGDYDEALASYDQAIRLREVSTRYYFRALVHRLKGDNDKALADLDRAIKIRSDDARYFVERAVIYRAQNDFERALEDNNTAIKLDPQSATAYRGRGRTREERNELLLALVDFRRAKEIEPGSERIARMIERVETKLAEPDKVSEPAITKKQSAATSGGSAGRRIALVIGNSRYSKATPLSNPKNDAEAIGGALSAAGFNRVDLKLDVSRDQLARSSAV